MRPKMKVRMRRCGDCGGVHADFWRSTPPPSCAERRSRGYRPGPFDRVMHYSRYAAEEG